MIKKQISASAVILLMLLSVSCKEAATTKESALHPDATDLPVSFSSADLLLPGSVRTVIRCSEFITLRAEPSKSAEALARIPLGETVIYIGPAENGFCEASYEEQTGYVLDDYLSAGTFVPDSEWTLPEESQREILSEFLTRFTRTSLSGRFSVYAAGETKLATLAVEYARQTGSSSIEHQEDGTARLSRASVLEILSSLLAEGYGRLGNMDFCSWNDTSEISRGGFAAINAVGKDSENHLAVIFSVYAAGTDDTPLADPSEAAKKYGEPSSRGTAYLEKTENGYRLISFTLQR